MMCGLRYSSKGSAYDRFLHIARGIVLVCVLFSFMGITQAVAPVAICSPAFRLAGENLSGPSPG